MTIKYINDMSIEFDDWNSEKIKMNYLGNLVIHFGTGEEGNVHQVPSSQGIPYGTNLIIEIAGMNPRSFLVTEETNQLVFPTSVSFSPNTSKIIRFVWKEDGPPSLGKEILWVYAPLLSTEIEGTNIHEIFKSFGKLHPDLQRWLYNKMTEDIAANFQSVIGWEGLFKFQNMLSKFQIQRNPSEFANSVLFYFRNSHLMKNNPLDPQVRVHILALIFKWMVSGLFASSFEKLLAFRREIAPIGTIEPLESVISGLGIDPNNSIYEITSFVHDSNLLESQFDDILPIIQRITDGSDAKSQQVDFREVQDIEINQIISSLENNP